MKYEESGNPAAWLAREIADPANDVPMAKCECTYQHAQCEEGQRLEREAVAALTAWQRSPLADGTQKLVELHAVYSACLKACTEHVKACSINA